ncbi:hypothetical protein COU79_02705 [Candidatus Peregrinibacteria bacterium CG10_big_fil_rev_8_21_14_0_10_54_7]|nr:MAG: hypothetical protein COU79_02705 [Candidatus Peregrinibacteria bacterium CG10_big_fil_rev_8_21_14_0_10_54_7]
MNLPQKNAFTIALGSTFLLVIAASATAFKLLSADVNDDGLIGIQINAEGPLSVEAGGSIRLTAEGDYGTMTMPVQARWSAHGDASVTLAGCKKTKECTVTAGEEPGMAEIEAEAEGYSATVMVEITEVLKNPFTDDLPEWALPSIVRLHRAGIIKGYDDGRFGPGDPVTRGQVVTLLYRMLRYADLIAMGITGCSAYEDVLPGEYMEEAVCAFAANGWGFDESYFLPNDPALRGVVAKLVSMVAEPLIKKSAMNVEELADGPQIFDDVSPGDPFFADVAVVNALGVMTGYPTGDFGVRDPINRAAVAVVMDRLLDRFFRTVEDSGHGSAPVPSVPSPSPSAAATAACIVQADNTATPTADQSDFGDGYAKVTYTDDHSLASIRKRCTDEMYNKLMSIYCSEPVNAQRRAQWGVILYAPDGTVKTGGGAASGSSYHECPQTGVASSVPAAATAACIVQADNITTPTADQSDFGDGYAKVTYTDDHSLASIRARCTDTEYRKLMDTYCSEPVNAQRRVQWGVILFAKDGTVKTGGGAASGSAYHECPQTGAASSAAETIACHDSDGGENLFEQGIIYGTFHGQPDRAQEFQDECLTQRTVKEYSCDRGLYIGYGEQECPEASTCRNGACTRTACEDSDNGQNFDVQGTVSIRNADTGEIESSSTDGCVDYGKAVHQLEFYCGEYGSILNTGKVCQYGCENGVCKNALATNTQNTAQPSSSSLPVHSPALSSAASTVQPSKDSRTQRTGTFSLSQWTIYFDFSKEVMMSYPDDQPYDIRVEKPGPVADQTKVWVYNGDGWISRINQADRDYSRVRLDDCIRQLKTTRRFDEPRIGAGDTVCVDTDDGYIVKMTRHWSGQYMEYERWIGEIDYSAQTAVSPTPAGTSSSVVSRPVSSVPVRQQITGAIDLSDFFQGLSRVSKFYDFSAGVYRRDQNDRPWDFRFSMQPAAGISSSYLEAASREGSAALFAMPTKRYEELTEADCRDNPDYASGHEAIIFGYNATVICFKTDDGVVGKMRGGPSDTDRVEFTIWK